MKPDSDLLIVLVGIVAFFLVSIGGTWAVVEISAARSAKCYEQTKLEKCWGF